MPKRALQTSHSFVTVERDADGRVLAFRHEDGTLDEGLTSNELRSQLSQAEANNSKNSAPSDRLLKRLKYEADVLSAWETYVEEYGLQPLSRVEGGNAWVEAQSKVQKERKDLAGLGPSVPSSALEDGEAYESWRRRWDELYVLTQKRLRQWDIVMYPLTHITPLASPRVYQESVPCFPEERWAFVRIPAGVTPPPFKPFEGQESDPDLPVGYHRVPSAKAAIVFDRASRGSAGWLHEEEQGWFWLDPREPDRYRVYYYRDGESLEVLRENVQRLNPRTADVWRLIMARSLEAWPRNQVEPNSVWVDVRELAEAMGYRKHKKGGFRPDTLKKVAEAIEDLRSMKIVLPLGETVYEEPELGKKKRRKQKLVAERHYYALNVSGEDVIRDLFGNTYPMRYLLRPGEWVRQYPRQFAPMLTELTRLPSDRKTPTWAKALGTELCFYYAQDKRNADTVSLKVRTFLERAVLLHEVDSRHASRTREAFEDALGLLTEKGVCQDWHYKEEPANVGRWFEDWLNSVVVVRRPSSMPSLQG